MSLLLLMLLGYQLLLSASACPADSTATATTIPLYVLVLVPSQQHAAATGARIARDKINQLTDVLPGYRIELIVKDIEACSTSSEGAGIGLSNLVKYTVNDPPCRPVVAVAGLLCSSHTAELARIAGHDGLGGSVPLQLSAANSPIFRTHNDRFPHLWHFLGSATAYTDTVLAMMDQFSWTRVGVVYDLSPTSSWSVSYLEQAIKTSHNKSIGFTVAVRGTKAVHYQQVISKIQSSNVTVILVMLHSNEQTSILLSHAHSQQLVYPQYTWIHYDTTLQYLNTETNQNSLFRDAATGHLFLHTQTRIVENSSQLRPSGANNSTFDLNNMSIRDITFAGYLYDQLWALGLAINNTLPVLQSHNISIDTIGQHQLTAMIEDQLTKLSYQGASGWVEFNQYRSVSTPINVFWTLDNGTERRVGVYNPLDPSNFHVDIDLSFGNRPDFLIPPAVGIVLFCVTGLLVLFTTIQLVLYLYYRNHKVIKATSPYLSLLMFAGCYLLYITVILKVTYATFPLSRTDFNILLSTNIITLLNGFSLILITTFIKFLRVYRIFSSRLKMDLGKYWNNCPLLITIIILTILPNMVVLPIVFTRPSEAEFESNDEEHLDPIIDHDFAELDSTGYFFIGGLIACYIAVLLTIILPLAICTRNIRHKNFKDTKKLMVFIYMLLLTMTVVSPLYIVVEDLAAANILLVVGILVVSAACQLILFLPKVLPVFLSNVYPKWESVYSNALVHLHGILLC